MYGQMHITSITSLTRTPDRLTVKVNGKAVASLSVKLVAELGLKIDQVWDSETRRRVEQAARYDKAMRAAMSRLNRRAMSSFQLNRKLRELGHDQDSCRQVMDRLDELGLVNDEMVGKAIIRSASRRQAAGPRLLKQKLVQKGLDARLIDELVDQSTDRTSQIEQAADLARRRLAGMKHLDPLTIRRRLYNLLMRRGFEPGVVESVMQELKQQSADPADEDI